MSDEIVEELVDVVDEVQQWFEKLKQATFQQAQLPAGNFNPVEPLPPEWDGFDLMEPFRLVSFGSVTQLAAVANDLEYVVVPAIERGSASLVETISCLTHWGGDARDACDSHFLAVQEYAIDETAYIRRAMLTLVAVQDLITVTRTDMAEIGNDFVQSAKIYVDAYEARGLELVGLLITGAFFAALPEFLTGTVTAETLADGVVGMANGAASLSLSATTSLEIVHAFLDAAKKLREQLAEAVQAILDDFDTTTAPLRLTRPATPVASIGSTYAPDLFRPSFLPEEIYVAAESLAEAQAQTPVAADSDSEVVKALAG